MKTISMRYFHSYFASYFLVLHVSYHGELCIYFIFKNYNSIISYFFFLFPNLPTQSSFLFQIQSLISLIIITYIHVNVYAYIYIPNYLRITCPICMIILVFMFSGLMTLYRINIGMFFPGEDHFSSSSILQLPEVPKEKS